MGVRRAEKKDVNKLVELGKLMHKESVYSKYAFDEDYIKFYGDYMMDHPDEYGVFMAEDNEGEVTAMVAGFISKMYFNPEVKIAHDFLLYVHPEKRGGIAAVRVMRAYEKWAKDVGASEVSMGITAGIDNERAERFFSGIGYDPKGSFLNKEL